MASLNILVLQIVLNNLAPVKRERFHSVPDSWKDRLCYFYILYRLESKDCSGTLRMPAPSQEVVECLRKNKVIVNKLEEDYYGYKKQKGLESLIEVVGKKRFGYQKDFFCNVTNQERFHISQAMNERELRYLIIEKPHLLKWMQKENIIHLRSYRGVTKDDWRFKKQDKTKKRKENASLSDVLVESAKYQNIRFF